MRLPPSRARAPIALLGVVAIAFLSAGTARAQTSGARPVITSAPDVVGFKRDARIEGRLEDGTPGDEVSLERRPPGLDWRTIATETTDSEGNVVFRVDSLRKTAEYRLAWSDEVSGASTYSDTDSIGVRPLLTLRASRARVLIGRTVVFWGALRPATAGREVVLQHRVAGEWRTFARVGASDGDFVARYDANRRGRRRIRVRFGGDGVNAAATRGRRVTVFRKAPATWYGPGFYGERTACGRRYTYGMLGVAHRTLPCGTEVALLHEGRYITVPVIDRGPYGSADLDLTRETAERLRFSGRDTIGFLRD
ncbi:MAG: septal ring lytic transglycosylase RlpA family protein [Actinomycetota bacterium]